MKEEKSVKTSKTCKATKPQEEKVDLELNLKRMEQIVRIMEDPSTKLDEKIKVYAEGVKLAKISLDALEIAKGQITVINNGKEEDINNG